MLQRWKSIGPDLYDNSVMNTSDELLNVNKEQLIRSTGVDGKLLPMYSWQSYAEYKASKGAIDSTRYDMLYTGYSYKTMHVTVKKGEYYITSEGYAQMYDDKLSGNILGIAENTIWLLAYRKEHLYPEIVNNIKYILNE